VKCDQLTDEVMALQRSLRDYEKASKMFAPAFLSPHVRNVEAENLKRILRLEQQVENQQCEMDRLRAKLRQAGVHDY
jgi:predicted RNase H-like nuclease (RuvC/YqgF family)